MTTCKTFYHTRHLHADKREPICVTQDSISFADVYQSKQKVERMLLVRSVIIAALFVVGLQGNIVFQLEATFI